MSKLLTNRLPTVQETFFSKSRADLVTMQSSDEDGIDLKIPMVLKPPVCIQVRSPKKFLVWVDHDAFEFNDTRNLRSVNLN